MGKEKTNRDKAGLVGWGLKTYTALFLILVLFGCAPKKIRVYESLPEIRNNIIQSAVSLQGRPYRGGAKGPDAFDCSGLVHYVYKKSNITLPIAAEGQERVGYEISRGGVLPGDLVFFIIKKDVHVGIMINRREFVHASKSRGVVIDSVDSEYWKRSLHAFRSVL